MTEQVQSAAPAAAPTTAAPAAAPVTAPQTSAPASAPATPASEGAFGPAVQYEKSGHAGLDMALSFLGAQGMGANHPAIKAASETGDFSLLKATLASKGIPGWEQHLALAEDFYASYAEQQAAEQRATGEMCVAAAGGDPAMWQATLDWASQNAEPHEKEAINAALAGGGLVAEAMAHFLVNGYKQAPGTSYEGKPAVNQNAGSNAPVTSHALSPREYADAVGKLHGQMGDRMYSSREYEALNQRRAMYRG
ncbi:head scaffolding protein [Ralstonia phage RS-PII-1]|uniref:Capsid and scaffold protein n=1 Tax=Ralstonia phage RS-PII-1 TaxID=1932892 RepID=A0A1L7DQG6_9CAUD|nr:head scaffolding protein [Ralstonia phage RS-PII-1]APU00305.1 capsid and scaffold protein [Ralstonia phage RS-PII-1]